MFQVYASEQNDCYESMLLANIDQQHFAKTQDNQKYSIHEAVYMRWENDTTCVTLFIVIEHVPTSPLPFIFTFYKTKNEMRFQTSWEKKGFGVQSLSIFWSSLWLVKKWKGTVNKSMIHCYELPSTQTIIGWLLTKPIDLYFSTNLHALETSSGAQMVSNSLSGNV